MIIVIVVIPMNWVKMCSTCVFVQATGAMYDELWASKTVRQQQQWRKKLNRNTNNKKYESETVLSIKINCFMLPQTNDRLRRRRWTVNYCKLASSKDIISHSHLNAVCMCMIGLICLHSLIHIRYTFIIGFYFSIHSSFLSLVYR